MSNNEIFRVGPCRILVAPAFTDAVANWTDLGKTRGDVLVTVQDGNVVTGQADQTGASPLSSAVFAYPPAIEISAPFIDRDIDKIVTSIPNAVKISANAKDALGFGSSISKLTPVAVALVAVDEYEEGQPWWDADNQAMIFKATANIDGPFETFNRPEGDDVLSDNTYTVVFTKLADGSAVLASLGPAFLAGVNPVGFDVAAELQYGVTAAGTRAALNAAGVTTMRELVDAVNLNLSAEGFSDLTGIMYWFYKGGKGALNLSGNTISQADASQLIKDLWAVRYDLDFTSLDISGNNGIDAEATAKVNGTGFYADAVAGVDTTGNILRIAGLKNSVYAAGSKIEVTGSTGNDGTYTVLWAAPDDANNQTKIAVAENVSDATADGTIGNGLVQNGFTIIT